MKTQDPIDMREVEPGNWMSPDQAKARSIVNEELRKSDFVKHSGISMGEIGRRTRNLPVIFRIALFVTLIASMIAFLAGPYRAVAEWLAYSL